MVLYVHPPPLSCGAENQRSAAARSDDWAAALMRLRKVCALGSTPAATASTPSALEGARELRPIYVLRFWRV